MARLGRVLCPISTLVAMWQSFYLSELTLWSIHANSFMGFTGKCHKDSTDLVLSKNESITAPKPIKTRRVNLIYLHQCNFGNPTFSIGRKIDQNGCYEKSGTDWSKVAGQFVPTTSHTHLLRQLVHSTFLSSSIQNFAYTSKRSYRTLHLYFHWNFFARDVQFLELRTLKDVNHCEQLSQNQHLLNTRFLYWELLNTGD